MENMENILFYLYLFFFVLLIFKQLKIHSHSIASSISSYLPNEDPKSKWQNTQYGKNIIKSNRQQQEKRMKQKQQQQQQQQQQQASENKVLLSSSTPQTKTTTTMTQNINILLVVLFIIFNMVSLFQSSKKWYDIMTGIFSVLFFLCWLLVIWSPDNYARSIQSTFMMFCIAFFCWNTGLLIFTNASKKISIMLLLITSYYGIIIRQNLSLNNNVRRNK